MSHLKDQNPQTLEAASREVERLRAFYANLAERCEALQAENIALRDVIQDDETLRAENQQLMHDNMDMRKRLAAIRTDAVKQLMPLRELRLLAVDDDDYL